MTKTRTRKEAYDEDLAMMERKCAALHAQDGKTYRPVISGGVVITNAIEEVHEATIGHPKHAQLLASLAHAITYNAELLQTRLVQLTLDGTFPVALDHEPLREQLAAIKYNVAQIEQYLGLPAKTKTADPR